MNRNDSFPPSPVRSRGWLVAVALVGLGIGFAGARAAFVSSAIAQAGSSPAAPVARTDQADASLPAPEVRERVEILLDQARLPAADLERMNARRESVARALRESESGRPSRLTAAENDAEGVLAESLAALAQAGAILDDGSAIVNFDTVEADLTPGARPGVAALPFVTTVRAPEPTHPAGRLDGEGIDNLGASISHAAGITGAGVTVAIIDEAFDGLNAMMALTSPTELATVPVSRQWCEQGTGCGAGSGFVSTDLDAAALSESDHGTAVAEVLYEIAPGATLVLYRAQTSSGIQKAIRDAAANRGAKVIVVARQSMTTMYGAPACSSGTANPASPATCNPYGDDVADAAANGALVVFPSGDYGSTHVADQFFPCGSFCDDVANDFGVPVDPEDRKWELFVANALGEQTPLLPLDYDIEGIDIPDDPAFQIKITCSSAIDNPALSSKYELRLLRDAGGDTGGGAVLPSEVTTLADPMDPFSGGFEREAFADLGKSFSVTITGKDFWADSWYVGIKAQCDVTNAAPHSDDCGTFPRFRVACEYPFFFSSAGSQMFLPDGSLSDMANVDQALVTAGYDGIDAVSPFSSVGPVDPDNPTAAPIKPDVIADSYVSNYRKCIADGGVPPICGDVFSGIFAGTSASAAEVGGLAALFIQNRAVQFPGSPFTPTQLKGAIKANAQDDLNLDDPPGWDTVNGAGLALAPNTQPSTSFFSLPPCRLLDTRCPAAGVGICGAPGSIPNGGPQIPASTARTVNAIGACNIPVWAKSVALNVTVAGPAASGFLTLFPSNLPQPNSSSLNFTAGKVRANNSFLALSSDGTGMFSIYNGSPGATHVIADVVGYFE